jgi:hypothetical protein
MAMTDEERKQYEEYCKVNDCSAYSSDNPPAQPDPNNFEMTMNCVEGTIIDQCKDAKFVMLENNRVT